MVQVQIAYEGQLHCRAKHGPSGAELGTDAPVDNMGKGETFSPTDLVATALGTCMLTIMGIVADRHGINLVGAKATVNKEMTAEPPRRIGQLTVVIEGPAGVSEEDRRRLEQAAATCPVKRSLHPDIEIPVTFKWG